MRLDTLVAIAAKLWLDLVRINVIHKFVSQLYAYLLNDI